MTAIKTLTEMTIDELINELTYAHSVNSRAIARVLRDRVDILRKMVVNAPVALDPIAAREWVNRLKAAKERNVGARRRMLDMIRRIDDGYLPRYPSQHRTQVEANLKEANAFASRVDSQIAFIEQFAAPEVTPGQKLFEKRHPDQKFLGLDTQVKDVWEELARHTEE